MKKKKILVVDDEKSIRKIFENFLSKDHEVLVCSNGNEALSEMILGFDPDIVITDLQMPPGMDGIELAESVKKFDDIPIILMTGRPDLVPRNNSVDLVLEKPFNLAEIAEFIQQV